MSKEELNAMKIQSMLQGISVEEIMTQQLNNEDDNEEIEIEIEEEEKKPKKKSAKKKDELTTKQQYIPELDVFKKIANNNITVNINYHEHDIKYKEQLWPVPERTIQYQLSMIRIPKVACDVAQVFKSNSAEELEKAQNGKVRYLKIVNFEESVSHLIREVGYIRVEEINGKLSTQLFVKTQVLKNNNANPEKVKKNLTKAMKELVA